MVLEKTVESPLDCKEIKPVNPKGSQSWIFIGRTDAEAEAPKLWPPDVKCQLTGKAPDAEKDWGQEERGLTEDEFVGWHHWLSGHYFEHTPGDSEEQRSLACYTLQFMWLQSQTQLSDWTTTYTANIHTHTYTHVSVYMFTHTYVPLTIYWYFSLYIKDLVV